MSKQSIVIDIICTKFIDVDIPEDVTGDEYEKFISDAVSAEIGALPIEINDFYLSEYNYEEA